MMKIREVGMFAAHYVFWVMEAFNGAAHKNRIKDYKQDSIFCRSGKGPLRDFPRRKEYWMFTKILEHLHMWKHY